MKKLSLIAIVMVLLASCNNVSLESKYVEESSEKDMAALVKKNLISEDEKNRLIEYISAVNIVTEDEYTYSEIIKYAAESQAWKERNAKIQEDLDTKMSVAFTKKYFHSTWDGQYIAFDALAKNNTDTDINGFSFSVVLKDGAGKELGRFTWNKAGDVIKAKSSKTIKSFTIEYDNYNDDLAKLKAADLDKLIAEYHIASIIFGDGTSLELEEP